MSTTTVNPPMESTKTQTPMEVLSQGAEDDKVQPEVKEIPKEAPKEDDKEVDEGASEDQEVDDLAEEEEDELNLDEPDENLEDDIALPGRISFKEVKKEFPELLKKYPQLQANYFKSEQYTEIFPTVEDAGLASQKAEIFDVINERALGGDINLILDGIEAEAPKSLNKIAETILPTLYKKNPQLYSEAMAPEIKKLVRTAIAAGERSGNENLKNAALVLQEYVFGPNGPPPDKAPDKEDPEKTALKNQANQMFIRQAQSYEEATKNFTANHLVRMIEQDLDPKGEMSDFVREKTVESILEDVNRALAKNPTIKREMDSHWIKAAQSGFPEELKPVIARAFLARAKLLLPSIKQKRRAEVFGKRTVTNEPSQLRKTNLRQSSGSVKPSSSVVSKQEIRKEGLSPMDVIMRGAK